ncbi:MAG: GNAT family N-acetyltransferase [Fimbriimonadaceae bacterium]
MCISTRIATESDLPWIRDLLIRAWHGPLIERTDEFIDASILPAIVAELAGERVGLATLLLHPDHVEIVTLNSLRKGIGIGSALMAAAERFAQASHLTELRLFAVNSNLPALGFYQRRGYRLWAVHRDTITRARATLKPEIPLLHPNGIVNADEVELRKQLAG